MKTQILKSLRQKGYDVLYVKSIFLLKDGRKLSRTQAMKLAGIKSKPRKPKIKQALYGDYAWIAGINKIK